MIKFGYAVRSLNLLMLRLPGIRFVFSLGFSYMDPLSGLNSAPNSPRHSGIDSLSSVFFSDSAGTHSTIQRVATDSIDPSHSGTAAASPRLTCGSQIVADELIRKIEEQIERMKEEGYDRNLTAEAERFTQSIKTYDKRYAGWKNSFDDINASLSSILSGAEYVEVNDELFDYSDRTHDYIKLAKEGYKWLESFSLLIFHSAKSILYYKLNGDFKEEVEKFERLVPKIKHQPTDASLRVLKTMQILMDVVKLRNEEDQKKIFSKTGKKIQKFLSKVTTIPLRIYQGIEQHRANKICKNIFGSIGRCIERSFIKQALARQKEWVSLLQTRIHIDKASSEPMSAYQDLEEKVTDFKDKLKRCKTLEEVEKTLNFHGMTSIEIPSTIEQWHAQRKDPRFARSLYDSFCYAIDKTRFWRKEKIADHLNNLKDEHRKKVDQAKPILSAYIENCKEMDFPAITAYLKARHIHLEQINIENCPGLASLPTTKEEWLACQSEQFLSCLASQYVDHQETTAQLSLQSARQMLLSKNKVEKNFLEFRKNENFVSIASSILQLFVCSGYAFVVTSVLDLIVTDISKFGIPGITFLSVGHPLYPNKDFKVLGIAMMLIEHFFAIKDKPNEYSSEGYKLSIQIRWFYLVARAHQLISLFQQMALWLNMRLVENCIMGLAAKPFESDPRYIKINEETKMKLVNCKAEIERLENSLDLLRVKDGKLCVSSDSNCSSVENSDPHQVLDESLADVNFDYFPPEIKAYYEDNLGIVLKEENKPLIRERLEKFFSKGEDVFIAQYRENRFAHLLRA